MLQSTCRDDDIILFMKDSYQYAFRDNAKGVYTRSKYVSKSDELEKYIFNKYALPYVQGLPSKDVFVDIGSGEGRYSRYFGESFGKVIAIEPDEHRYQKTTEGLADMKNVECVHGTAGSVQLDKKADAIVNIHVLQHIHKNAVEEILDFVTQNLTTGGVFVLVMTKKTELDYPWNIAWQDDKSRYSAVPKQVFEYVTSENVLGVLPVRKEETETVLKDLQDRGFSIEVKVEYAPRFVDQRQRLIGKIFMFLYMNLPVSAFHRLINFVGYPLQEDVLIVARKN